MEIALKSFVPPLILKRLESSVKSMKMERTNSLSVSRSTKAPGVCCYWWTTDANLCGLIVVFLVVRFMALVYSPSLNSRDQCTHPLLRAFRHHRLELEGRRGEGRGSFLVSTTSQVSSFSIFNIHINVVSTATFTLYIYFPARFLFLSIVPHDGAIRALFLPSPVLLTIFTFFDPSAFLTTPIFSFGISWSHIVIVVMSSFSHILHPSRSQRFTLNITIFFVLLVIWGLRPL